MICFGSRPTLGSSRIMISGNPSTACASPTLCRYPLDRFLIRRFSTSLIFTSFSTSSIDSALFSFGIFFSSAANSIYSLTVISIYSGGSSGRYPICFFASSGSFKISCLLISTSPSVAPRYPVMIFMVVDFPAPLGPKKP